MKYPPGLPFATFIIKTYTFALCLLLSPSSVQYSQNILHYDNVCTAREELNKRSHVPHGTIKPYSTRCFCNKPFVLLW